MLVKGRVCRSPFYIKFPTLYPSLFAIVIHSLYFMTLLVPPPKCWKTFSIKANQYVYYHFSFYLLYISVSMSFCSKQDCDFLQVAFAWYCPILLLPVEKAFTFQQSDSRSWLWMLLAEIFSKYFSMKLEKQRSKLQYYFKEKGYSRIYSKGKKRCLQGLSKSLPIPVCTGFTPLQSLGLIILFGVFLYKFSYTL